MGAAQHMQQDTIAQNHRIRTTHGRSSAAAPKGAILSTEDATHTLAAGQVSLECGSLVRPDGCSAVGRVPGTCMDHMQSGGVAGGCV